METAQQQPTQKNCAPAPAPAPSRPRPRHSTHARCAHLPTADGVKGDAGVDLHGAHVRSEQVSGAGLVHDTAAAAATTRDAPRVRPERVDGLDGTQFALVGLSLVACETLVVIGKAAAPAAAIIGTLTGGVEVASANTASAVTTPGATAPPASSSSAGSLTLHGYTAGVMTGWEAGRGVESAGPCVCFHRYIIGLTCFVHSTL